MNSEKEYYEQFGGMQCSEAGLPSPSDGDDKPNISDGDDQPNVSDGDDKPNESEGPIA